MKTRAKIWVTLFLLLGGTAIAFVCAEWTIENPVQFAVYAAMALAASILRARSPESGGLMWAHPLFVVLGLLEFSVAETTVTSCACLVIETVWRRTGAASLLEVYFGLANLMVAIAVTAKLLWWLLPLGVPYLVLAVSAGAILFAFTTFPWAAVTSLAENRSVLVVWRQSSLCELTPILAAALLGWVFHIVSRGAGWETATVGLPTLFLLHRTWRLHIQRIEQDKIHAEHLALLHMRTVEALALAIEAKDTTTRDHLRRMQVYATGIGQRLGMSADELQALAAAAVLHDIGKLAVPEHIISKPGRLTPEEFERMKIHPVVGAEILEHVSFPWPVVPIVRAHHEKWNGSGYPDGLTGEHIPLGARILAAVDALDALASDRQYRRALPLDEAMKRVEAESGSSFDPRVVEVLRDNYAELERKAQAKESTSLRLSVGLRVDKRDAPAAGFEEQAMASAESSAGSQDVLEVISRARHDLQELVESAKNGGAAMDRNEFFARFAVRLQRLVPHDTIVVWLAEGTVLKPSWVQGAESRFFRMLRVPVGEGLSGWVAENRRSVLNGNPAVESGYLNDPRQVSTMRAALSVPVERAGQVFGAISLYQEGRDSFTREHASILQSLAPRFAAGLEIFTKVEAEAQSTVVATVDDRDVLAFLRQLAETIRRNARLNIPVAVVLASVETEGGVSPVREEAIRAGSASLAEGLGDYESFCRIGSNEFAAIVTGAPARTVMTRLSSIRQAVADHDHIRLAAGSAQFPADGRTAEELFAIAESRVTGCQPPAPPQSARAASAGWVQ